MEEFIKVSHDRGVYRALVNAGLVKEANAFVRAVQQADKATSNVGNHLIHTGVGAGMGAMAAGEGNRGMGALLGGLTGLATNKLTRMQVNRRLANPNSKFNRHAASWKNYSGGQVPQNVQNQYNKQVAVRKGINSAVLGAGAGVGLNMMT